MRRLLAGAEFPAAFSLAVLRRVFGEQYTVERGHVTPCGKKLPGSVQTRVSFCSGIAASRRVLLDNDTIIFRFIQYLEAVTKY